MKTALLLATLTWLATPAWAQSDDLAKLLGRHGLRAVPPTPAAGFELPDLNGKRVALADARGRWVILTFFATWCGPCRAEMPSLDQLHRSATRRGLDVLGVAIDGSRESVRRFVEGVGASFPVLLDSTGEVAGRYQAHSVPVSYILDPAGRVVAVARGARDWAKMGELVDGLLATAPADPSAQGTYAEQLDLPSTLVPPTAEVTASTTTPEAGEPFTLDVRITWAGHLADYLLHPPAVHLPEAVTERATSATTSSSDGGAVVTYQIELEAGEPGAFALDPVELRYTPRGEKDEVATRLAGPTVEVAESQWLRTGWVAAALALLAGFATAVVLWRRAGATPETAEEPNDHLTALFDDARRRRLEGDIAGFLLVARDLARELDITDELALDDAIDKAKYGGRPPAPEQLDQWQRRLRRHIASHTADSEASDTIRLANPNGDQS